MAHQHPRILYALHRLNDLQVKRPPAWVMELTQSERELAIEQARTGIPHSILSHHELLFSRGNRSLAKVLHGACGACHMKLPAGHQPPASPMSRVDVCDNCGVFLVWPEVERAGAVPATSVAPTKRRKGTSHRKSNKQPSP